MSIDIFDTRGRRVARLADGDYTAGRYTETWNGTDDRGRSMANGIYYMVARIGAEKRQVKLTLLK